MYEKRKARINGEQQWMITLNGVPETKVTKWLLYKSMRSEATAKKYATNICRYLNYLHSKGIDYTEVQNSDINSFILNLRADNIAISHNTLSSYIATIKEFYKYLEDKPNLDYKTAKKKISKEKFLYGQIWGKSFDELVTVKVNRNSVNNDYIKWYTKEQIEALRHNFLTKRDEAIFLLTLEGMRIDEVLSITLDTYDSIEGTVRPTRSKTAAYRVVPLREHTQQCLDDYVFSERDLIDTDCNLLFININKGRHQGQKLTYRNYIRILKDCAKRAGLDPTIIRTHSGRSTRTMELLQLQTESDLTDEQIRLIMGWNSPSSIHPYINYKDSRVLLSIAKKINEGQANNEINKR